MDPMGFPMEKPRNIFQADLVFYPKGTVFCVFFSFFFVGRFKRNNDSAKRGVETHQLLSFFVTSLDFGGPSCIAPSAGGGHVE